MKSFNWPKIQNSRKNKKMNFTPLNITEVYHKITSKKGTGLSKKRKSNPFWSSKWKLKSSRLWLKKLVINNRIYGFWEMLGIVPKLTMCCTKSQGLSTNDKLSTPWKKCPTRRRGSRCRRAPYTNIFIRPILRGNL